MRQRSSSAIEQLRRRGRLFARDLRLGHIGAGRRWPPYLRPAAITLILALATALVVAQNFLPNRLNLKAGEVSSQDVVSQRSVRYESQTRREEARAAAAAKVPDQFDGSVSIQQRQAIDSLATKVADLRRSSGTGPDRSAQLSLLEPQLSDAQRQYLLQADEGTVATVFKSAGDTAQTRAAALRLDPTGASVVATLIRAMLKVSYLQAETALKRQQASDAVPAVFVTVAQGQTIIRYGDLLTPFQLEEPQAVGLLAPKADWARILAVLMLVLILFIVALGYLMQFRPAILRDPRQLATLGGLMLVLLLVAKLVVPINPNTQYLVPMAAVPLLVAALMDTGLGIIVALAVGLLTGIVADNVLPLTLVGFLGGAIGSIYVHRLERLGQWVTAGILVAGAQFVTLVSLSLIERHQSLDEILTIGVLALINGLLSALIAAGLLTWLGEITHVVTPMKLLELMTPNNPLLKP